MISGSIVALITPFTTLNLIDFRKLAELIEYHHFSGTDGLLILGTTGESTSLSEYEKDQLVEFVVKQTDKRMKIIVGIITNDTQEAIKKAIKYELMEADALLLIPPFYNKTSKNGLINHFKLIASKVKIPIILYNIPSRVGMNIDLDVIKELKSIPNITGIKEANKDINHILDVFMLADGGFNVYCGNDELSYLFLSLGSKGLINVYGNLEPQMIKNLIYIYEENPFLALQYFKSYYELLKMMSIDVNPIPIKALMNYNNMNVGHYRLPLVEMDENKYSMMVLEFEKCKKPFH